MDRPASRPDNVLGRARMSSRSKGNSNGLSPRYFTALQKHLATGPRASLRPAAKLGREALSAGLGTVDLAKIHQQTMLRLAPPKPSSSGDGIVGRAGRFLVEALTPIEDARLAALGEHGPSNGGKPTARRGSGALAATSRRLELEIARRKSVQDALKKSERHYGHLLERSRHMQEHLRRLSHEILSAQEEERRAISRELHDEIGQTLTAIKVKLVTLNQQATINAADLKRKIASTQRLVQRSMNTVHRFARNLRPPLLDDLGLIPALHSFMRGFTKRTGVRIHFATFAAVEKLDGEKRTVLYRVAQEALTNVAKHAQASLVNVSIQPQQGVVLMEIHDDGKSFEVQRVLLAKKITRLGLLGMRERVEMVGGRFEVESAPRRGTTIRARIPLGSGRVLSPDAPGEVMR
jgi:two-component system sensor histidine kinase DegS